MIKLSDLNNMSADDAANVCRNVNMIDVPADSGTTVYFSGKSLDSSMVVLFRCGGTWIGTVSCYDDFAIVEGSNAEEVFEQLYN